MKKKSIIAIVATVLLIIVFVIVFIDRQNKDNIVSDSVPVGSEKTYSLPESKINLEAIPEDTNKLEVDKVEVNNFLSGAIESEDKRSYTISEREKYQILYIPEHSQFLVSILDSPFGEVKAEAEDEFIKMLNTSKEEVCKLNVVITTPIWANPDEAGQNYSLSFCN